MDAAGKCPRSGGDSDNRPWGTGTDEVPSKCVLLTRPWPHQGTWCVRTMER